MSQRNAILPANTPVSLIAAAASVLVLLCWTGQASAQPPDDCLQIRKISTSYDALRQGSEFDVHVFFRASGCALSTPTVGENLQSRVRLVSDPGLQLHVIGMDFAGFERLSEGHTVIYGAHESTLYLRFAAAPDVTPGIRHPSLLVNYDTIDRTGHHVPRSIEVEIPVNVVVHDAPVKMQSDLPKWNPLQILLIPFRLIQLIFTWDGC